MILGTEKNCIYCGSCSFNDGNSCTSNPPRYKCTFDKNFYDGWHHCHLDLQPVVRCKNCEFITDKTLTRSYLCIIDGTPRKVKGNHFCGKGKLRKD